VANSLRARCECDLLTANSCLSNSFAKQTKKKKRPIRSKKKPKYQTNFIVKAAIPFTSHSGYIVFLVMKLGLIPSSQRVVWDKNRAGVSFHYLSFSLDLDILLSRLSGRRSVGVVGRSSLHYHEHVPWHGTPRQNCVWYISAVRQMQEVAAYGECLTPVDLARLAFIYTNATVTNTCPSALWYPPLR
jgi:hypothetical protein